MKQMLFSLICFCLTFGLCSCTSSTQHIAKENTMINPIIAITTDFGEMQFELFEKETPNTVANIIELAESGFYQNQYFHRVIKTFMAQGGCPYSKEETSRIPGTGGPGYTICDEFNPELIHSSRGLLSMANVGRPNTNGSQFFITFAPTPWLDGKHTVFGKMIKGQDVLDKIEKIGSQSGRPKQRVRFDIKVIKKNDHLYCAEKLK